MSTKPDNAARMAVGLRYEQGGDAAPRVVATGKGVIADEILRRASAAGVVVREDPALAEALSQLDLGEQIPPELFRAVAEILAYVYSLDASPR
jgi:flagellar biosynthesis protein